MNACVYICTCVYAWVTEYSQTHILFIHFLALSAEAMTPELQWVCLAPRPWLLSTILH